MRVLVTGGGGFLGGALVRALRGRGHEVRSFSRRTYPWLGTLGVEQLSGDLADSEAVQRATEGCESVFHVAALAGAWGPTEAYERTNVDGTRHVIEGCQRHGVRDLVYTSTPSVVFDGGDMEGCDESVPYARHFEADYPRTKAAAERLVLQANGDSLRTVALRPHLIWGPGDTQLLPRMVERRDRLRRIGVGGKRIAPTFIDDAVSAHLAAAAALEVPSDSPPAAGKAYFVTSGETIEVWTMIDRLLAAAGRRPVEGNVSRGLALAVAGAAEGLYRILGREQEPPLTRWVVRELTTSHWFDLGAARRDLGWEPSVSIDRGLELLGRSLAESVAE